MSIRSSKDRVTFGCTLTATVLEKIDKDRGLIPRTRYIEQLLAVALELKSGHSNEEMAP